MDKIITYIFKRNCYVNSFPLKLLTACIKSIAMHAFGWDAYEYIQKLEELIPTHKAYVS